VISRETWGAKYGRGNVMPDPAPKSLIVIHHSASPHVDCGVGQAREMEIVRGIERHHVETNGWAGLGYSFLVFQSGDAFEGRGWGRVGAHTPGRNSTSYGVCLVINGDRHTPTEAALEAVRRLVAVGIEGKFIAPSFRVGAHRQFKATDCPGALVMVTLSEIGPLFP
jgi:N-acetylmuramoyl-L-alanine amidase